MSQLSKSWQIIKLDETESTNLYLKNLLLDQYPKEFTVITTDFQTKGRGQMGNSWNANRGENLLFSILIYPRMILANQQFVISQMIALSVRNVLAMYADNITVKWPNDIYWNDKKIAGILIENNLQGTTIDSSVIGVGLNLNQKLFPEGLINPISLYLITGHEYDRDEMLDQILQEFINMYNELQQGERVEIEKKYFNNLYRAQGYHWYQDADTKFRAEIIRVLPTGHLILRVFDEEHERMYAFKEIQFVNI